MKTPLICGVLVAIGLTGCVDQYGRVRPPDPIGQAIFNALDPAPPVYQSQEYVVTSDMPPPRYEPRPMRPVSYSRSTVYVDGYWAWHRNNWVWVPGRWVERPRSNAVWVNSTYYNNPQGRYWRSGYWR